jgi:hypothetical protein
VPDLGRALAGAAKDSVGRHRAITLSRYALLVESANNPGLRAHIAAGGRVNIWIANWLRMAGSTNPEHDTHVLSNYVLDAALGPHLGVGAAVAGDLDVPGPDGGTPPSHGGGTSDVNHQLRWAARSVAEGSARWTAGFPQSAARNRIREQAGIVGSRPAAPTSPVS